MRAAQLRARVRVTARSCEMALLDGREASARGHLHELTASRLAGFVLGDRPIQTRTAWARLSSITHRSRSRRRT